jgi:hypothetical protein
VKLWPLGLYPLAKYFMYTTNLFSSFGDVIELNFPTFDLVRTQEILDHHPGWQRYNPRKNIPRYGLSITSLDGGYSGIPDLDSLSEYNRENNTTYSDKDFTVRTDIANQIPEVPFLLDAFSAGLGRCHFLRLDAGGFFPPHRDNGHSVPSKNIRIIVPLLNTGPKQWKWLQEDQVLHLEAGKAYCINTTKVHSVYSFVDNCVIMVMNVVANNSTIKAVTDNLGIY